MKIEILVYGKKENLYCIRIVYSSQVDSDDLYLVSMSFPFLLKVSQNSDQTSKYSIQSFELLPNVLIKYILLHNRSYFPARFFQLHDSIPSIWNANLQRIYYVNTYDATFVAHLVCTKCSRAFSNFHSFHLEYQSIKNILWECIWICEIIYV